MSAMNSSRFFGDIYTRFVLPYFRQMRRADNAGDESMVELYDISLILDTGKSILNNTPQRMRNLSPLIV